jgi:4-hydroxy-3-methylbut-2-en-1-yl diphosphate reductase
MQILLANPRGFCAGVDRAIDIVERAIDLFGAPIYVRHEVVHNKYVVDRLRTIGAVFVEELNEVPDGATVIFSAHGVSRVVQMEAKRRSSRCSMPPVRWSRRCTWKSPAMRARRARCS